MGNTLAVLPLSTTDTGLFGSGLSGGGFDPTVLGGTIPTSDPGINIASNGNLLNTLAGFASSVGNTVSGVLNTVRFGTGPNSPYAVQAQAQAVSNSFSITTLLLVLVAGYFLLGRKK